MGAAVSAGDNNDGLIDNLLEADYIKTALVERVFRAVDRGEYFLNDPPVHPYRDSAWRQGNLHISAPCIYSEVMEGLHLTPGLSFLNLGSGTGYLSTMVGLILGSNGVNHGVEYYQDVIDYANKKLDEFKKYSGAMDEFDFCEPKFIKGNCLCLASGTHLYDRVYCGAACPEPYMNYMKNLIKVGGILIVPLDEQLLEIKRKSETEWESNSMLPVSFATLIIPPEKCVETVVLPEIEPLSLQELCRTTVRTILRGVIENELPKSAKKPAKKSKKIPTKKRHLVKTFVVPIFGSDDSSDEGQDIAPPYPDSEEIITCFLQHMNRITRRGGTNRQLNEAEEEDLNAYLADEDLANNEPLEMDVDEGGVSNEREKLDSGFSEDMAEMASASSPSSSSQSSASSPTSSPSSPDKMNNDESSCDDDDVEQPQTETDSSGRGGGKRSRRNIDARTGRKWRRVFWNESVKDVQPDQQTMDRRVMKSELMIHMKKRIQQLPLPSILRNYLNFYREF